MPGGCATAGRRRPWRCRAPRPRRALHARGDSPAGSHVDGRGERVDFLNGREHVRRDPDAGELAVDESRSHVDTIRRLQPLGECVRVDAVDAERPQPARLGGIVRIEHFHAGQARHAVGPAPSQVPQPRRLALGAETLVERHRLGDRARHGDRKRPDLLELPDVVVLPARVGRP